MKLLLFLFLTVSLPALAQDFPKNFVGHWEGTLEWHQAGNPVPRKVRMQLVIQPADTLGQYTWQIIYGAGGEDNRPYLLKPVDTAKGHWVVDERNGILLDQFWVGQRFTSVFSVQNSTILDSYYIENGKLVAEFYSYTAKPLQRSGKGTDESPFVDSFATKAYQRAVMERKK